MLVEHHRLNNNMVEHRADIYESLSSRWENIITTGKLGLSRAGTGLKQHGRVSKQTSVQVGSGKVRLKTPSENTCISG